MVPPFPGMSTEPKTEFELRWALRQVFMAWWFGAAWLALTTGATLTQFAKSVHLSEFGFGLLAAIPFMAALVQMPASFLMERFGHRKLVFMCGNLVHRSLWLAIAAIPWVFPEAARATGLITLMLVSAVMGNVTVPSWYSWIIDIVPARIRGRYFSRRIQAGQIVNFCLTIAVGVVLDWAAGISGVALSRVLSALLAAGAVLGVIDILYFARIPDRSAPASNRHYGFAEMVWQPLQNRSFRHYLAFTATITFSTGYIGQFAWLYAFDVLKTTNMQANLMLIAWPLLTALMALPFWGRMIDRLGRKPVALITTALVIPGGAAWVLVTGDHWFPAYAGVLLAAFAWSGVDLASYNILLGLVGRHKGERNTAFVALNSIVVAASGTLSGLFGGLLARSLSGWQGSLWGIPLTYHGILFLLSGLFRLLAVVWLRGIDDPRAFSARDALRYMATDMYSNLQNTVLVPVRLAGRWTYKLAGLRWRKK